MQAITALTQRSSCARLSAPGPTAEHIDTLFACASRAADHGQLRPWRLLLIEGEGRNALGELYCAAAMSDNPGLDAARQAKYRQMPLRAPALIVVIGRVQENAKIPPQEQLISAGAAAQNMINGAFALGLGAMWRTGEMAYHPQVLQGLGLKAHEQVIGYIYLGTPTKPATAPKPLVKESFLQCWP